MRRARERGSALLLTIVMMAIAIAVVTTLLVIESAQTSVVSHERDDLQALYVAEAGLSCTLESMASGGLDTVGSGFAGGAYVTTVTARCRRRATSSSP
jgi:hypothetical protein